MKVLPSRPRPFSPPDLLLGSGTALVTIGIWFLGNFHGMHDSDSLIHPLNSLYHWTVFVWEYDHNGSLLSLLAKAVGRPYLNVLAISFLSSFLFLSGLSIWGSLISSAAFVECSLWVSLLAPLVLAQKTVFQNAAHGVTSGTALFFSGVFVCGLRKYVHSGRDWALLPALFGLAFLTTYLSKIAFIPLAVVTIGLLWEQQPLPWRSILAVAACLALALLCYQLLEQASSFRKDYTLHLASLPIALPRLLSNWGSQTMTGIFWLAAPVLLLAYRSVRQNSPFLCLTVGVVIQTLVISCSRWAAINGYDGHYLYDLSFVSLLAVLGLASRIFRQRVPPRLQRRLWAVLVACALTVNAWRWNSFHPTSPLSRMERTLGTNTPAIVAADCDLIVGDYWTAWPTMLAVNDYYYRNNILSPQTHRPRQVYAITYLAASTEHLWRPILDQANVRLCSLASDEAGYERYLSIYAPELALQTARSDQIGQAVVHRVQIAPLQSVALDFDQLLPGKGWSIEETSPNGETFRWMEGTEATIMLPMATDHDLRVEFRLLYTMSLDILQSLTLTANGQPVPLALWHDAGGAPLFSSIIPQSILAHSPQTTLLVFHVSHTLIPQFTLPNSDDPRALSLAFDWLRVAPTSP